MIRPAWRRGGWRERFFVVYFFGYSVVGFLGLGSLIITGAPLEMVASYGYALTFGFAGLWPLWYMTFSLYVPVLQAMIDPLSAYDPRRPFWGTLISYLKDFGSGGRFPGQFRFALLVSIANAAMLPLSLVFILYAGYSIIPRGLSYSMSPSVLYAAAWIFPVYGVLLALSIHHQNHFARTAEARGYPLWSLRKSMVRQVWQAKRADQEASRGSEKAK